MSMSVENIEAPAGAEVVPVKRRARCYQRLREEDDIVDPKRLTNWIFDGERSLSCHAAGAPVRGGAWLIAECAAVRAKGKAVCVRKHPSLAGYGALFLE